MISIIIPVYNVRPYILKCLDSVKAQTHNDWECIIINDGSTDGGETIAHQFADSDNRFTLLSYENAGLPTARNRGMDVARGDKIYFLDSDDWMEPNSLEVLDAYAEKHPSVGRIIGPHFVHIRKMNWHGTWPIRPLGLHAPDSPDLFGSRRCDVGYVTGSLYIKKNIPCELSFPQVRIFEDMIFNMGLMFAGMSSFIIPEFLYHYERRDDSLINTWLTEEDAKPMRQALADYADRFNPKPEVYGKCLTFLNTAIRSRQKEYAGCE